MQLLGLSDDSKLPVGVKVRVWVWLCLWLLTYPETSAVSCSTVLNIFQIVILTYPVLYLASYKTTKKPTVELQGHTDMVSD